MIIQDPIKAAIWFALDNYAYPDAIFLSERLYAEASNEENLYLLATAYYRSGKYNVAYSILSRNKYNPHKSSNCHFLRAKCCFHLGKIEEAANLLVEPINDDLLSDRIFSKEDLIHVYGENASFVAQLLGQLFNKLEDTKASTHYYTLSLKLNPFLWYSYEKLLQIEPSKVDIDQLFNAEKLDLKFSCGRKESIQQDTQMIIDNEQTLVNPVTVKNNSSSILTRRSSRLINSDQRSIKENSSAAKKLVVVDRPVTPVKRCRRKISFDKSKKIVKKNNNENDSTTIQVIPFDIAKNGVKTSERSSANCLIELIKKFAIAYKRLAEYRCRDAIEYFKKLPTNHYNTGFVLSMIGRCHFEMGSYEDAINCFKNCRKIEPYRLQGLEIYSTALWHLQKELELSCLSQELIQFDKLAPETWCVAGNCFSLQKDHEISIKFLKRAIQVDPNFSYAYTLLGHELISADELDNAMSCFVNATRIDPRHYNAWCGISLIYYKQEKYDLAYQNYKRALDISPYNPILMCHLAILMHHLKKSRDAINLLNEATKIDPQNVNIKYQRALIRFSLEEYDQSLAELEELKTMVPKESVVFFLIGRIHKIRGETHLALLNFSWAVHIDPKGSANQHKEFTEPNQTSPEELIIHTGHLDTSSEMSSTPTTTPFTQRSTYITGPINSNYSNISIDNSIDMAEIDELIDAEIDEEELEQDDEIDSEYPIDSNATEEDI